MKLIVAVDSRWGIGKNGDLLLSIPDDMRFFREKTRRAVLVMGYNTLLSFPGSKPLPNRLNIALNDAEGVSAAGTVICGGLGQLFGVIRDMNSDDVFVIGGGSIYRQMLPYCDAAYITKMRFDGDADTFFPNLDELREWSVADESELFEYEGIKYSFVEYRNSAPKDVVFSGKNIDVPAYFVKKREAEFEILDTDDESYRGRLGGLLRAYFRPLCDGLTAKDVEVYISEGGTLVDFLKEKGCIASAEDIDALNREFDPEGRIGRVTATFGADSVL